MQPHHISDLPDAPAGDACAPVGSAQKLDCSLLEFALRALRLPGTTGIAIALEDASEFVCRAAVGETVPAIGVRFSGTEGITGECIRTGQTITCNDVHFDHRVNLTASKELGIASLVAVPLKKNGRAVGILEAYAIERNTFGHRTIVKLERIAAEITRLLEGSPTEDNGNAGNSVKNASVIRTQGTTDYETASEQDMFVHFSEPSFVTRIQRHWNRIMTIATAILLLLAVIMVIYWWFTENSTGTAQPSATAVVRKTLLAQSASLNNQQ